MPRFALLLAAGLLACAAQAQATSFVMTTDALAGASVGVSESTSDLSSSFGDDKIVLAARDDAASFIASQGTIRGAQLEAAFKVLREDVPQAREASDQALAEAILAR